MTEEEYFRKHYPDFCYGDRPLSPYWDLFQDGVEFGERQSVKRIEELEKENEQLRNNGFTVSAMTEQQLKVALEKGEQLEKDFRICEKNADTYYDQLTKAKDLIHQILIQNPISDWLPKKAEQFLKEIEKCQSQKRH